MVAITATRHPHVVGILVSSPKLQGSIPFASTNLSCPGLVAILFGRP